MRKRIGFALIGLVVLFAVARIAYAQVTTNGQ